MPVPAFAPADNPSEATESAGLLLADGVTIAVAVTLTVNTDTDPFAPVAVVVAVDSELRAVLALALVLPLALALCELTTGAAALVSLHPSTENWLIVEFDTHCPSAAISSLLDEQYG